MADLEIIFGSNAPEVTREIANAEKATIAAAKAASQLDKAVASEARTLKTAAQAAREYAKELRSSQNALTGAPGASRGNHPLASVLSGNGAQIKTNVMRGLASANREIRATMEKVGNEAGGRFSAGIRGAIERNLTKYGGIKRSPIAKMLGGVGEDGNATRGGEVAAATLAISAAWFAVNKAIQIANATLEAHNSKLKLTLQSALDYKMTLLGAAEANRAAGVGAAQAHGSSILSVTANGGQAALDKVREAARRSGTDENDAAAAYSTLYKRFAGDQRAISRGLDIGADVAKVTGRGLNDTIATLGQQELGNKLTARDRLTALALGHIQIGRGDYNAAAGNVAGSPDARDIVSIRGSLANADVNQDRQLPAGRIGAMEAASAAADPGAKLVGDRYNAEERQIEMLRKVEENTRGIYRVLDRFINPTNTARRQLYDAEDQHILGNGGQPVQ